MPSPMQRAVMAHWRGISRASGITVSYFSSASTSITLTMVPARTETENEFADGRVHGERIADFIVPADNLGLTPEIGHRILWGDRWYEVLALGLNSHYEWADHFQVLLRIHTKRVAEDVEPLTEWTWQDGDGHVIQAGYAMEFQESL